MKLIANEPSSGLVRRLNVRGRMVVAIFVPVVALVAMTTWIGLDRHDDVRLADAIAEDVRVVEQLAELRSAVFSERLAAELLLPIRRPPDALLETTEFGSLLLDGLRPMEARSEAALAALAPTDRPFEAAELIAVRADRESWASSLAGIARAMDPFDDRLVAALNERGAAARDAAVELGDSALIEAGSTFQRTISVPIATGQLIAAITDLWVAAPVSRLILQSDVAAAAAAVDVAYERFALGLLKSTGSLREFYDGPMQVPSGIHQAVEDARHGVYTTPERPAGSPVSLGLTLLRGVDWIAVVDELPLLAAQAMGQEAQRVETSARSAERSTTVTAALVIGISVGAVLLLARSIITPVDRLTRRAQEIGRGRLDGEPLELKGPPDVVAASHAFNDVVDNLSLLEQKTRALADLRFDDASLGEPLPGQLGASLERSVHVLSHSIIEREELQTRVVHEATHDPLTGLASRSALVSMLRSIGRQPGPRRSIAVIFIDLNDFKRTNDRYGHAAGDSLLQLVAARLQAAAPPGSFVARRGGDEFAVVLRDVPGVDHATTTARDLLAALMLPADIDGQQLGVAPSAGVAISTAGDTSRSGSQRGLLHRADLAVRSAKDRGPGLVAVYDEDLDRRIVTDERLAEALSVALAPGVDELHLVYQPIVGTDDGRLHAIEALIRWERPGFGLMAPDSFIPIAERSPLIVKLDQWVLEAALLQLASWTEIPSLRDVAMSVNVSGRSLLDPTFAARVTRALAESSIPSSRLKIEVTETALVTDLELAAAQLGALRALGVRIVIDDYGTGYTSVAHLRALPVDELKIDSSYVQRLDDPDDRALVRMVNELAHILHLPTVAEGVETAEQFEHLRSIGCDALQGYFFSRPLRPQAFVEWVDQALSATSAPR